MKALAGPLLTIWAFFYNRCREPLAHITYQISKLYALWFLTIRLFFFRLPLQLEFFVEFNSFNNFDRTSSKEHLFTVSINLAGWFRRRSCLKKLLTHWRTHARTMDDRQWDITKAHIEVIILRLAKNWWCAVMGQNISDFYTLSVKRLLTTTPQQRPPLNYDHLFLELNTFSICFNYH